MGRKIVICFFGVLFAAAAVCSVFGGGRKEDSGPGAGMAAGNDTSPAVNAPPLTVRVGSLKGPSGFGMIRLFEYPPDLGKNVETAFEVLPSPLEMVARTATGQVDIAVFPPNIAAKLYTEGPGYRLAAVTGMGVLTLVTRDTRITTWEDLRGKTVSVMGRGATPDYLFRYFLTRAGMSPERDLVLDFSINNGPQLSQMLMAGRIDTAVLPEPFATMVVNRTDDVKKVIDFQEEWGRAAGTGESYPITVVVVSPKLVRDRPEVVRKFLEAYEESIHWVNTHPMEAALLIEKYDVMPAALAEPAIPFCNLEFIPAGRAKLMIEEFLSVLLDFDPVSVGGTLPNDSFYLE